MRRVPAASKWYVHASTEGTEKRYEVSKKNGEYVQCKAIRDGAFLSMGIQVNAERTEETTSSLDDRDGQGCETCERILNPCGKMTLEILQVCDTSSLRTVLLEELQVKLESCKAYQQDGHFNGDTWSPTGYGFRRSTRITETENTSSQTEKTETRSDQDEREQFWAKQ
ncbi:hypothetical protein PM082_012009 [Marasmius tenuissimus]|nr:hypothetical protein PM082_012009 [Marasmius tenuissimus]